MGASARCVLLTCALVDFLLPPEGFALAGLAPPVVYVDVTDTAPCFPFYFRQVHVGEHRNFAYALGDPSTRQAALVDAAFETQRLKAIVERDGYRITHTFATHWHDDHAAGLDALAAAGAQAVLHESWRGYPRTVALGAKATLVPDGAIVKVGQLPVQMLHTPGHTPESSCLLVGERGAGMQALLGGDTLFVNACGRADLAGIPASVAERQMFDSLRRLAALPGEVQVFPGHAYAGFASRSLDQQRRENPALAVADFDVWKGFWFLRRYDDD